MRKTVLLILLVLLTLVALSEAKMKCALCGKEIEGKYIKYNDDTVYCMDCVDKYPRCSICGKPSKATTNIDGREVCRSCLIKLNRCSFCGKPITGKYFSYPDLNLRLCPECNKKIPKCDLCGKPDLNLIRIGENRICRECFDSAKFCHICGNPIQGEYMWFDGDSTKLFCKSCIDKYPKCSTCGAPAGKNRRVLDDGRILCHDCYNAAYFDPSKVKEIKEKILAFIDDEFDMRIEHKVRYVLEGKDFIKDKSEGLSGDLNGLFYRQGNIYEIYVLYGLRQKDLYQVVSHEIAHAWAADNCRENLTLEEAEGFAQWIAYYTLKHFGYEDFSRTLLKGENEYARGLRQMLMLESKDGRSAVVEHLAK